MLLKFEWRRKTFSSVQRLSSTISHEEAAVHLRNRFVNSTKIKKHTARHGYIDCERMMHMKLFLRRQEKVKWNGKSYVFIESNKIACTTATDAQWRGLASAATSAWNSCDSLSFIEEPEFRLYWSDGFAIVANFQATPPERVHLWAQLICGKD